MQVGKVLSAVCAAAWVTGAATAEAETAKVTVLGVGDAVLEARAGTDVLRLTAVEALSGKAE